MKFIFHLRKRQKLIPPVGSLSLDPIHCTPTHSSYRRGSHSRCAPSETTLFYEKPCRDLVFSAKG